MASPNQSRDARGRFAAGGNNAEASHRDSERYPVTSHDDQKSVASHTGRLLAAGLPTPNPASGRAVRNSTVAETLAKYRGVDARVGKRNVYHG